MNLRLPLAVLSCLGLTLAASSAEARVKPKAPVAPAAHQGTMVLYDAHHLMPVVKDARIADVAKLFRGYEDSLGNLATGVTKAHGETWPKVVERFFGMLEPGAKIESAKLVEYAPSADGIKKAVAAYTRRIRADPFDAWEKALPKKLSALLGKLANDSKIRLVAGDYHSRSRAAGKLNYQALAIIDLKNAQLYGIDDVDE